MKQRTCFFLAALLACNLSAQDISLPAPQKSGGMPLMDALAKRATSRAFDSRALSDRQLANLLWATFGINRPDGKRTAPSAHNEQATDVYVLMKQGAYVYAANSNKLGHVLTGDIRSLGATQAFAANAPVILVFVADLAKMGNGDKDSKLRMANLNLGYISQNTCLYCASEGLATGPRDSVDRKALRPKLNLRPDQIIILAQSVGYPGKETQ